MMQLKKPMITHKKHKPDIPKPINGERMNDVSFSESRYFLARLTKIDKKRQQLRFWIKSHIVDKIYYIIIKIK